MRFACGPAHLGSGVWLWQRMAHAAVLDGETERACALHAHLALMCLGVAPQFDGACDEVALSQHQVATLLRAHAFLTAHYSFRDTADAQVNNFIR